MYNLQLLQISYCLLSLCHCAVIMEVLHYIMIHGEPFMSLEHCKIRKMQEKSV